MRIRSIEGSSLPGCDLKASLIIPGKIKEPVCLVYNDFRTLRRWNRSRAFGIADGTLADQL